jgi:hypothetical protein
VVRNTWWEFLQNGPGQLDQDDSYPYSLGDAGQRVTFDTITGTTSYVQVIGSVTETVTPEIHLFGHDNNGTWIRTQESGSWIDGEKIDITTAGTLSTKMYSSIERVIKPSTDGPVYLYEYDTTQVKMLAQYEPSETVPVYRASKIPGIANTSTCSGSDDGCSKKWVTVVAKLRHIPVSVSTDFMVLQNLSALKLMCKAIKFEEAEDIEKARYFEEKALFELDTQLNNYHGPGMKHPIASENRHLWGAGGVENVIT